MLQCGDRKGFLNTFQNAEVITDKQILLYKHFKVIYVRKDLQIK
jgi:hypothetical protein